MKKVEIIEYEDRYKQDFKYLNYEWIEKSFTVETTDAFILANPVKAIIDKGGYIYFARYENKIVGTFALLKVDEYTFEIAKMAVAQKYQNRGIGKQLMEFVMEKAKLLNIERLILYSHTDLSVAINMYFKYGFKVIPKDDFHNNQANIKMEYIRKSLSKIK